MGAILKVERLTAGKSNIQQILKNIIEEDGSSHRSEEDLYRGDFGSSALRRTQTKVYEGKTEAARDKNFAKFEAEVPFEKYVMDYGIIGQLGFIAHTAKVRLYIDGLRGPFVVGFKEYKNVTELKKALKNPHTARQLYGEGVYKTGPKTRVGTITSDSRTYKTKPKALPKKYQWLDELVEVAYGGLNLY